MLQPVQGGRCALERRRRGLGARGGLALLTKFTFLNFALVQVCGVPDGGELRDPVDGLLFVFDRGPLPLAQCPTRTASRAGSGTGPRHVGLGLTLAREAGSGYWDSVGRLAVAGAVPTERRSCQYPHRVTGVNCQFSLRES